MDDWMLMNSAALSTTAATRATLWFPPYGVRYVSCPSVPLSFCPSVHLPLQTTNTRNNRSTSAKTPMRHSSREAAVWSCNDLFFSLCPVLLPSICLLSCPVRCYYHVNFLFLCVTGLNGCKLDTNLFFLSLCISLCISISVSL